MLVPVWGAACHKPVLALAPAKGAVTQPATCPRALCQLRQPGLVLVLQVGVAGPSAGRLEPSNPQPAPSHSQGGIQDCTAGGCERCWDNLRHGKRCSCLLRLAARACRAAGTVRRLALAQPHNHHRGRPLARCACRAVGVTSLGRRKAGAERQLTASNIPSCLPLCQTTCYCT